MLKKIFSLVNAQCVCLNFLVNVLLLPMRVERKMSMQNRGQEKKKKKMEEKSFKNTKIE